MAERFPAVVPQAMTADQRAIHDEICRGPRGAISGPFEVLLHAPRLEQRLHRVGEYLR